MSPISLHIVPATLFPLYPILFQMHKIKNQMAGEVAILEGLMIADDARYRYAENYLRKKDCFFHARNVSPERLDFIVFPFKTNIDISLYSEDYFAKLRHDVQIFSGTRNDYIAGQCAKNNLEYYVLMEDLGLAVCNAIPTSEGIIAYLITNRDSTIFGSHILILGFGVCGSDLGRRLTALGAKVYTVDKSRERERLALCHSIIPISLGELETFSFDAVINTIPAPILTNAMLEHLSGALMLDIASQAGFDMEAAKRFNEKSNSLPGIPGKYAVRYAGELLGQCIVGILERNQKGIAVC